MKLNKKKIIILLAVIVVIITAFFFFIKSSNDKINADKKSKSATSTEELPKNDGKTNVGKTFKDKNKPGQVKTNTGSKDIKTGVTTQGEDKTAKVINKKEGFTVFIKDASFGSIAEMVINNSNVSYKYYQYFLTNKPISGIESISKKDTIIFPGQKAGNEVTLKLLDGNKKVRKELKILLSHK